MHPSYARQVSSCRVLHLKLLRAYNICIIYLHLIEVCLKVTIAVLFLPFGTSLRYYEKYF